MSVCVRPHIGLRNGNEMDIILHPHLTESIEGSRATLALNRPDAHNALDDSLIAALLEAVIRAGGNPHVRSILFRGEGPTFSAGADLGYMARVASMTEAENRADADQLAKLFLAIYESPKVTVARVHGAALGGGAGLAAACDLCIAAEEAVFGFTEVRLGLAPAVIAPYVIDKIGVGAARALFLTAERFSASRAFSLGLAQDVVPLAALDEAVEMRLAQVEKAGPNAVAAVKELLRSLRGKPPHEASAITSACIASLRVSAEGKEGISAFLEKRPPNFAG